MASIFDLALYEWLVLLVLAVLIHLVGYHLHRRHIIGRLLMIRAELDQIKLEKEQAGPRSADDRSHELELMERAEKMLGTIGIDPYEHLRGGHSSKTKAARP